MSCVRESTRAMSSASGAWCGASPRSSRRPAPPRRRPLHRVVPLIVAAAVLMLAVGSADQSPPTLLDQFAAGFQHQYPPPAPPPPPGGAGPVLPDSLPLPASVVATADPCYDHEVTIIGWRRGVVVSGVRRMNEVNARRARLVPGWVTVFGRVYHLGV